MTHSMMSPRGRQAPGGPPGHPPERAGRAECAIGARLAHRAAARSAQLQRWRRLGPLLARVLGAIFGGYGLAALSSVAVLALPVDRVQAVIAGMLLSFVVFCAAVIWVFAVRSARRAWLGLGVAALPLLCLAGAVWAGRAP